MLKIELPYDPAIALLSIYPKDTNIVIQRGTCTRMFIAAMSTIAKLWKEPRCPSTDEWIKKMWYIYTMEHYAAIRRNEVLPFATTWMELERIMLREISQTMKGKYHVIPLTSGIFKKMNKQIDSSRTHLSPHVASPLPHIREII